MCCFLLWPFLGNKYIKVYERVLTFVSCGAKSLFWGRGTPVRAWWTTRPVRPWFIVLVEFLYVSVENDKPWLLFSLFLSADCWIYKETSTIEILRKNFTVNIVVSVFLVMVDVFAAVFVIVIVVFVVVVVVVVFVVVVVVAVAVVVTTRKHLQSTTTTSSSHELGINNRLQTTSKPHLILTRLMNFLEYLYWIFLSMFFEIIIYNAMVPVYKSIE